MSTATRERPRNTESMEQLGFKHFAAYAAPHGFSVNEFAGGHWQAKAGHWNVNWYTSGKIVLQGPMGFNRVFAGSYRQAIDALVEMISTTSPEQAPHPSPVNGMTGEAPEGPTGAPSEGQMQQEVKEPMGAQAQAPAESISPQPGETIEQATVRTKNEHRIFTHVVSETMELPPGVVLVPNIFPETQQCLAGKAEGLRIAIEMIKTYGPEKAIEIIEAQLERFVG